MRQNPHVRICGGPGSATTLVYPTLGQRLGRDLGQHGRHGRRSDDQRRRAGTDRGRGLLVNGIRTRASAWTKGDSMPSHDRGAYGKNT